MNLHIPCNLPCTTGLMRESRESIRPEIYNAIYWQWSTGLDAPDFLSTGGAKNFSAKASNSTLEWTAICRDRSYS